MQLILSFLPFQPSKYNTIKQFPRQVCLWSQHLYIDDASFTSILVLELFQYYNLLHNIFAKYEGKLAQDCIWCCNDMYSQLFLQYHRKWHKYNQRIVTSLSLQNKWKLSQNNCNESQKLKAGLRCTPAPLYFSSLVREASLLCSQLPCL